MRDGILLAELSTVFIGIKVARDLLLQTDSSNLVRSIATLCTENWSVRFKKIYREGNMAAGSMSKLGG
ncbi:hypothetical protein V6N13_010798 [Hibiscus sabdariffa]